MTENKSCPVCGKTFCYPKSPHQIHCSRACASVAQITQLERLCEQCGKPFKTFASSVKKGDGRFCSIKCYGRSIAKDKQKCTCVVCGKTFEISQADLRRGRGKYCSHKCSTDANKKQEKRNCLVCGNDIGVSPAKARGNNGNYCSKICFGIARQKRVKKNCLNCDIVFESIEVSNRLYCSNKCVAKHKSKQPDTVCLNCGKLFIGTSPSEQKKGYGKYCSKACFGLSVTGENSPHWRGGTFYSFGLNWDEQREFAYNRDNGTCQYCGLTEKQSLVKYGAKCDVHHIVKRRWYRENGIPIEESNQLTNLVVLCKKHHRQAESSKIAVPVRLL